MPKSDADKLPKVDALTLQAVLSAPAAMTGTTERTWQRLRDSEIQKLFGERGREIEMREDALANLDAAVQVATQTMQSLAGPAPETRRDH